MAVKEYIPRLGDATDQFMGPPDTEADVFDRAKERGVDVDGTIHEYRNSVRTLNSVSVVIGRSIGTGPKLRGRWKWTTKGWVPRDAVARSQATSLGMTIID